MKFWNNHERDDLCKRTEENENAPTNPFFGENPSDTTNTTFGTMSLYM